MAKARVPTDDELRILTTRAVAEIIPHQEFVDGLRSGKPMRLKIGLDPTKPVITLGWAVPLRKLRRLQDLGHTVVIIIGDWTARIGDPSEQSQTRPELTEEVVKANSEAILPHFYKILDPARTEIRRQTEWFDQFALADVVRLAARTTVARMLERDDFAQRYAAHRPISLHEFLYPLLQAYDSIAVEADVEFGGTDQKFNNLLGREMQRAVNQKAGPAGGGQAVFLVPLLVGLDGAQKMSQSLGNFIAIDDPPHDMYGKLMSIPDSLMMDYYELLTDVPEERLAYIRKSIEERIENPMDHKMRLAREIVTQYHGEEAAGEAEDGFVRTFREGEKPAEAIEVPLHFGRIARLSLGGTWPRLTRVKEGGDISSPDTVVDGFYVFIVEIAKVPSRAVEELSRHREIVESGRGVVLSVADVAGVSLGVSRMEATRLLKQGAVDVDGQRVETEFALLTDGSIIRVGKHRFLRIVDVVQHPQSP